MSDPTPYQNRYWKEFYQLRVHVNYLELYMGQTEVLDKSVNIFLAITSSSSICGWAIWNKYGFVWAVIIAASQLVTAIKQFLPYKTRLKALSGLLSELEELSTQAEMRWFDVAEGHLPDEDINKLQYEIRTKKIKSLNKHLGTNTLPKKAKLFEKAEENSRTYINNFYGG
jgi:hypothetical protein